MVLYNEVYFGHRLHTVHANEVVNHSTQNKDRKGNSGFMVSNATSFFTHRLIKLFRYLWDAGEQ